MESKIKQLFFLIRKRILCFLFPESVILFDHRIKEILNSNISLEYIQSFISDSKISKYSELKKPYKILNSQINDFTYLSTNSYVNLASIGKFCSIGPNFLCGWGIHPINGISTSPMFYSIRNQNGTTLSKVDKVEERKPIKIGNDVFIGANVTVLDGITIGDGAVIGAGAVVSKDIPPYAIAVGCPVKVIKYRFDEEKIEALLKIKWWEFEKDKLAEVEQMFFQVDEFIKKYAANNDVKN